MFTRVLFRGAGYRGARRIRGYESHIVAAYSSLCSDAARDNGEHAVLNAHGTRASWWSPQGAGSNIKSYVQDMFKLNAAIPEILHAHYDVYMHEVVDRAYTRLKTSDNLSLYLPWISRAIAVLSRTTMDDLHAEKLANIQRATVASSRERIREMLVEMRDELKSIDPILESIDDKNRRYSCISTDGFAPNSTRILPGRERSPASFAPCRWINRREAQTAGTPHLSTAPPGAGVSYTRQTREVAESGLARHTENGMEAEIAAAELRLRITNQLNPAKLAEFLSSFCPVPGAARSAEDMVDGVDSFVRIYAADYAEARDGTFPFSVDWQEEEVTVDRFRFFSSHRSSEGIRMDELEKLTDSERDRLRMALTTLFTETFLVRGI